MAPRDPLSEYHDYRVHEIKEKGYKLLITMDEMNHSIVDATLETIHGYVIRNTQLEVIRRGSFKDSLNEIRDQVKDKLWVQCIHEEIKKS